MSATSSAEPSVAADLQADLQVLSPALRARLDRAGFDPARLGGLAASLRTHGVDALRKKNRVEGDVHEPAPSELEHLPDDPERLAALRARGERALREGRVAFCVLAGGMATRMGGVVKALVPCAGERTFLDLRLAENRALEAAHGRPVPLWLMTSDATHEAVVAALAAAKAPAHVRTFLQNLSVRLAPDGAIFRDDAGEPSTHAGGHGDLPDALRRSGLLADFVAQGGEVVWITNLDNLGASVDPAILGAFLEGQADVMVEVCPKAKGDRGGIPVHAEGRLQVVEEFRLPEAFDPTAVRVFNTNTFLVRARPLLEADLRFHWFAVEKKVDGRVAVQFERLLQEITRDLSSRYLVIPREGEASRFLPVKDHEELEARRAAILAVAKARGML